MKFSQMNEEIDRFLPGFKGDKQPLYSMMTNAYSIGYKEAGIMWNSVLMNTARNREIEANSPAAQLRRKKEAEQSAREKPDPVASEEPPVPIPVLQPRDSEGNARPVDAPADGWGRAPTPDPVDKATDCWHRFVAHGPMLERCIKCGFTRPIP